MLFVLFGFQGLPLDDVYRQLFNLNLYLLAYSRIYKNAGATTRGVTEETVDGMSRKKIEGIIEQIRHERFRWTPVLRVKIPKKFDHLYRFICRSEWIETALKAVLSNIGARTAGIDGMTKKTLASKTAQTKLVRELQAELKSKQFRPMPVRRVYIPKANGKQRPLDIPTLKDRTVQMLLKMV